MWPPDRVGDGPFRMSFGAAMTDYYVTAVDDNGGAVSAKPRQPPRKVERKQPTPPPRGKRWVPGMGFIKR